METKIITNNYHSDPEEDNHKLGRNIFRIWSHWPIILVILLLGIAGAYTYLRYATRYYEARARMVVMDNSEEKNSNIIQTIHVDSRGEQLETEEQIEILQSKDLLMEVAQKLKLNIQWANKNGIQTKYLMHNLPVELTLESSNAIDSTIEGFVNTFPDQNKVQFRGRLYPADTIVNTFFGRAIWHINRNEAGNESKLFLKIRPMNSVAEDLSKNRLKVTPINKQSAILDISLIDEIPERGVQIISSLIDAYSSGNMTYNKKVLSNSLGFIDDRLKIISEEVNNVEKELQEYKSGAKITDLAKEGQNFLEQVKDNDQKLSEIDIQMSVLQQIEKYVSQRNQSSDAVPATLGLTDQVLVNLLNQLFQDEFDLQKMRKLSGVNNPMAKVLEEQINQLKPSILQSVANLKSSLLTSRNSLLANNSSYDNSLKSIPGKERELLDISRQRAIKNDIYTYLLQKREEKAIAISALTPNFRMIESPASIGLTKPQPWAMYSYGILASLFLASLWVYRKEFRSSRILYRSELDSYAHAPVIGEIVYQKTGPSTVVIGSGVRSLIAEQFRELRTNLSYIGNDTGGKGKVLLLTSFIPKEGKSFISLNLRIRFAITGKKVALLEFDLYNPKISHKLDIVQEPGITDFLKGEAAMEEIIKACPSQPNLWVLPAGTMPDDPAELILNGRLSDLMDHLKNEFDIIIMDSPCLGLTTDSKILADYAHVTLYVLRQNYTRRNFLKFINQTYESGKLPNMNLVFNGIKIRRMAGMQNWSGYGYNTYKYRNNNLYSHKRSGKISKRLTEN